MIGEAYGINERNMSSNTSLSYIRSFFIFLLVRVRKIVLFIITLSNYFINRSHFNEK